MSLRDSLEEHVSRYMSKSFAKVADDESVYHAARVMQENGSTEAVVVKKDTPVGIITERDILFKVVAAGLYPQRVKASEVMSSPLECVEDTSKVGDAIARMSKLGIRRLGVTQNGKIVGMITQKAIVSGNAGQIVLPELAVPDAFVCPYCNAVVKSKEELSKHIDRTHIGGAGLLEGDTSKW
jgi:signal-transduction protein with cAMP-binding, CBS, and nucleotidyltransferase domain